jgi:hypothetical protein
VTLAEEVGNGIAAADHAGPAEDVETDADIGVGDVGRSNGHAAPRRESGSNPWEDLVQMGAQFVAALVAADDPEAPAHPWIQRDPATGARSLKMPLPSPQTARQLADALSALADGLRGRNA